MAQGQQRRGQRFQGNGGGGNRQQRPVDASVGQQGNVWIGERPSSDDFASWFTDNVKIHDGLHHDDYIGGVVLIEQKGRLKKVVEDESSQPQIVEFERLEYTPYAKVDVRMKYLWDLCDNNGWLGVVEPAGVPRVDAQGYNNMNLPEGFFRHQVQDENGKWVQAIACTMRVSMFDRNACRVEVFEDPITKEPKQRVFGIPIRQPASATKVVPILNYGRVDESAFMKAETGAAGRALGMAGMLVIPGSGIATAEDVQEALETRATAVSVPAAVEGEAPTSDDALPEVEPTGEQPAPEPPADEPPAEQPPAQAQEDLEQASDDRLRELVERDLLALRQEAPAIYETTKTWWEEDRKLGELNRASIQALQQPMLRGVVRKIRRTLEEARQASAQPEAAAAADGASD